jgi:Ser/Thr protein kinase RdoA (MazF antagonist)
MKIKRLEKLLSYYRSEEITDFKQIIIGVSNDAYSVICASGSRYVIRVIHLQTAESARAEALIQQVMTKHGISTPVYLRLSNGEFVGRDDTDTFTIATLISGRHPKHGSLKLVQSLGAIMATLHNILQQDEIAIGYNTGQWLNPRNILIDIARCNPATQKRLQPIFDETLYIFDKSLPMAIIHGELASNNIFAKGDEVTTVFDFETAEYAPRILDVAFSYLSFVYDEELEPALVRETLLKEYNSVAEIKLTSQEEEYLPTAVRYVSAATAAWCFSRNYDEYGEKFLKAGIV